MRFCLLLIGLVYCCAVPAVPLKGFNTNAFLYDFPGQQFNQAYVDTLNRLQPDVLRFPGGTIANKYHFFKPGYGQGSALDKKTAQNYIVEFVRLIKSLDKPPKVLFVVNMFEHFHKPKQTDWELIVENLAALLYLKEQGVEIAGVELGNEFYIYPVIRGWDIKLPDNMQKKLADTDTDEWWPDTYRKYNRLARLYHAAIKKIDPAIPTGIPMGSSMNKNHTRWNAFAKKMTFSDAYIQHWYGQLSNATGEQEAVANFDRFTERVADNIKELKDKYRKQVWITEWNAIDFGFNNDRNMIWRQTPLHVRLNTRMQTMLDTLNTDITIYHRISSGKQGDSYNLINVVNGILEANPTYEPFTRPPFVNR